MNLSLGAPKESGARRVVATRTGQHVSVQGFPNHTKLAYTIDEASELVSLSRSQLYRLIEIGELGSITVGKARRITYAQLEEFIQRKEQNQGFVRFA